MKLSWSCEKAKLVCEQLIEADAERTQVMFALDDRMQMLD
jgi:hypothetical protein